MKRIDRAIKILKDAERDFRLPPTPKLHNHSGLCLYIMRHSLLQNMPFETMGKYFKLILENKDTNYYTFAEGFDQGSAWGGPLSMERANWCKKRIKELKQQIGRASGRERG